MQTASELLGLTPPAPLSAILVARPVRACVFVPPADGVSWETLVEHALAAQTRVWGGAFNLVVPPGWNPAEDELFWRLVDRFDPDVLAMHRPTYADAEEIAPEQYANVVARIDQQLQDNNFGEEMRGNEIARLRDQWMWGMEELPAEFQSQLVERIAPLHLNDDEPRIVYVDGSRAPSYPLTDLAVINELPDSILDIRTTLGEAERLMLTHSVGRLLPSFRGALEERELRINEVVVEHQPILLQHVWSRGGVREGEFGYPRVLTEIGLGRRISLADRDQLVVVVGDEPRDFFLYHGLSRLRPYVYWLPASRLADQPFVYALAEATHRTVQREIGGGDIVVTSTSGDEAAGAAVEALNAAQGLNPPTARLVDWKTLIPNSYLWAVDPKSERRISLFRHDGETQELQTPTPVSVSVSPDDPVQMRWMVDVEVQGWQPARHPALGDALLRGPVISNHDARTSSTGPTYFGQSPIVQAFLGLEGSAARPRLRTRSIVEQVSDVLQPQGWQVSLSDKGAYALQSALLFGGVAALAGALRTEATRALLDAYMVPGPDNDPGMYLRDSQRRYISLEEAEVIIGEADVPKLFADLYDQGVIVRGHVLKCEHCRATSFYSLSEEQTFTCVRCRTAQRATRFSWLEAPEPVFRYALSEVVFLFLKNNGQLPLLAAHHYFVEGRERERRTFDIAFEIELTPAGGSLREHDILATWGSELWIGEATIADRLEDTSAAEVERLERLKESAQALCARGVLLVTTRDAFSERTKGNVETVFADPTWPDVVYQEGFDVGAAAAA